MEDYGLGIGTQSFDGLDRFLRGYETNRTNVDVTRIEVDQGDLRPPNIL